MGFHVYRFPTKSMKHCHPKINLKVGDSNFMADPKNVSLKSGSFVTHVKSKTVEEWFSWIEHYRTLSGKSNPPCCIQKSYTLPRNGSKPGDCNGARSGAHVIIGTKRSGKQYIVPVCTYHNDAMMSFFSEGDSFKVNKVTAVRALSSITGNQQKAKQAQPRPRRRSKTTCNATKDNRKKCTAKLHGRYKVNCGRHQHIRFR